jgi:predicted DNA-binding transcriptional regulator AlpA
VRSVEPPVFFTHADLQRRYACSRVWVRRQIQKNHFPEPIKFGGNTSARRWQLVDVTAWEIERARINGSLS